MALLLYTRLPTIFDLKKTDTAAAVSEVLQKNEWIIRWVDNVASSSGEFSESQQGYYATNTLMLSEEICKRARVYIQKKCCSKRKTQPHSCSFLLLGG